MHALSSLDRIFRPRGVAVVGASARTGALATRFVSGLQRHGFPGAVVPVNPNYDEVAGLPCQPSIEQACAVAPVDLAVISVARDAVVPAVVECGAHGIAGAIVFSSGFAETGAEGRRAQERLGAAAREAGVRLIGPNSPGFVNVTEHVCVIASGLSFRPSFSPGRVGLVVQSGGIAGLLAERAQDAGAGLSTVVCTGNEVDVTAGEVLAWLAEDPATDVVGVFLEGVRQPARFLAALQALRDAGKPVVCLKAGATGAAARATAAHTGALASDDDVLDAVFARTGVVRVHAVDDLVDTTRTLAHLGTSGGGRVAVVTTSGGAGVIAAEAAERAGLCLPEPAAGTRQELAAVVPTFAAVGNPADMSGMFVEDPAIFRGSLGAFERAEGFDAVVLVLTVHPPDLAERLADRLLEHRSATGWAPVVLWVAGAMSEPARARLRENGVLVFDDPDRCMRALRARLVPAGRAAPAASGAVPAGGRDVPAASRTAAGDPARPGPDDPLELVRDLGIPTVACRRCATEADAVRAAAALGGKVAVKVDAPAIVHKSDVGGVVLGVEGPEAVARAHRQVVDAASAAGQAPRGSVVQPMVAPGVELIVGVRRDRDFGAVLVVGMGGTSAELVHDARTALLPLAAGEAAALLRALRGYPLLDGFRGAPRADLGAAVEAVEAVAAFGERAGDELEAFEVNPLVVHAEGWGVTAVDAVRITREAGP